MLLPHDSGPAGRGGVRRPSGRSLSRLSISGFAIATAVAVGACGSTPTPVILNTERIERAIEQATLAQRNKRVNVSCPSGVIQKKGVVFTCTATYKGGGGQFVVTETDGAGGVHYEAK